MSRRKNFAARTASGRLSRLKPATPLLAPTQVRRLLDSAATEVRHAAFGTQLGRLYLSGQVSASEFAAGKRWAEIVANYSISCRSPRPPRTVSFDALGGSSTDPDSESGAREVKRHEQANRAWLEGRNALRLAGREAERVVDDVCARDCALAGFGELNALRAGLQALAALWSAKRKASAR